MHLRDSSYIFSKLVYTAQVPNRNPENNVFSLKHRSILSFFKMFSLLLYSHPGKINPVNRGISSSFLESLTPHVQAYNVVYMFCYRLK